MSLRALNSTTFEQILSNSPSNNIELRIGDVNKPDFKPHLNLTRWHDNCFSIKAIERPNADFRLENGKFKYLTSDYEVHIYDRPELGEFGGTEFEWVFSSVPSNNIIEAEIDTTLELSVQKPLSARDILDGAFRPENMNGGIVAYHKTKRNNRIGGNEYRTGKVFDMPKARLIDALGNWIWVEYTLNRGLLTMEMDRTWLSLANYPIRLDPDIGYTSAGASTLNLEDITRGSRHTFSEDGTGVSMSIYSDPSGVTKVFKGNVYDHGDGDTDASVSLIANGVTDEGTPAAGGAGWRTVNFTSGPSFSNGVTYRFVAKGLAGVGTHVIHYDDSISGAYGYNQTGVAYPDFSDPSNFGAIQADRAFSIYATYTAAGGGAAYRAKTMTLLGT